ncbi:hypothetical protein L6452_25895 [Arctium lappa]|uniref:Uncharacterized protein n=1 Tax=Arctium lappa TaxID=4217 RepID=A0ACB9ABU7_ARCLA|nr:hypothetical protein L6452_25895 [Arctium lappa]
MYDFDARYLLLIVMNLMKLATSRPWEWDPFDTFSNVTWIKFSLLVIFFVFFASTSIHVTNKHLFLQFRDVSAIFTISFVALIVLPQLLFWYVYPLIPFLSYCSQPLRKLMNGLMEWFEDVIATVPDVRIHITAEHDVGVEPVADEVAQV